MTRDRANEVLFLWKVGAELFPPHVINAALRASGDLAPINLSPREARWPVQLSAELGPMVTWRTAKAGGNTDPFQRGEGVGPTAEEDARLVRVPGSPTGMEGSSLALSQPARQRASVDVLETAGTTDKGNAA